jgi:hypothetical protein
MTIQTKGTASESSIQNPVRIHQKCLNPLPNRPSSKVLSKKCLKPPFHESEACKSLINGSIPR